MRNRRGRRGLPLSANEPCRRVVMIARIPVDLIKTTEALNDIWSTDPAIVAYARNKDSLSRPRTDPLFEPAFDLKFALLDVVVNAVRDAPSRLLRSTPTESVLRSPASLLLNMKLKTVLRQPDFTSMSRISAILRGLTLCFERSKWRDGWRHLIATVQPTPVSNQSSSPVGPTSGPSPSGANHGTRVYGREISKWAETWPNRSAQGDASGRQARFQILSGARNGAPTRRLSRVQTASKELKSIWPVLVRALMLCFERRRGQRRRSNRATTRCCGLLRLE